MKLNLLFLLLLLLISSFCFAQDYTLSGKVAETKEQALPFASILLLQPKDSTIVQQTSTNDEGSFSLKNIQRGEYLLKASFVGYNDNYRKISFSSEHHEIDLGLIILKPDLIELEEVVISSPDDIQVKEDTVEYNAEAYITPPNANVEQLLKRLPDLEVERDGNITVQGERVTRIFVDGKEYYGGNLQMATRNIPADAIKRVQVIDEKSEEARFSGVADGKRQKIINVTLKESAKNSHFGKLEAGAGTSNRYSARGNYDRMNDKSMLSLYGSSNNINNLDNLSQGSESPKAGNDGNNQGPAGITTAHSGGINFFNQLSEKSQINGNYMADFSKNNVIRNLTRQNFIPVGSAVYNEESVLQNSNMLQMATVGFEHQDSINTFRLNTSFNFIGTRTVENSSRQSFSETGILVNEGIRTATANGKNFNINSNFFYGHKFLKSGRLLTVTGQIENTKVDNIGISSSMIRFYEEDPVVEQQQNNQDNKNLGYAIKLTYTEPLRKRQFLQTNYSISNQSSSTMIDVFDVLNEVMIFNEEQSTNFNTAFLYQHAGASYRLSGKSYNFAIGGNFQYSSLSRNLQETDDLERKYFMNFLPNLDYNRQISRFTRIMFNYNTSVREPSIDQLQPVLSTFDPFHIYIGNPGLRPEYTHQGKVNVNTSSGVSGLYLSGSITFNYKTNPIIPSVNFNERQIRTTQYVNVKQNHDVSALLNLGIPINKIHSRFKIGPYVRQGASMNLLNGVPGEIYQRSMGGNFSYSLIYKEFVDLNLRSNISRTKSEYDLDKSRNQVFTSSTYTADITVHFLKKYNLKADFNLFKFKNASTNFNQNFPIVNFSFSRYIFNQNRGEIKLSAFNVLDQHIGATQFATINYIEQSVQNTLSNFYMLSFIYNIKKYKDN